MQESIKQERLQKLKSDPSRAGIKLFVAGVNGNGNALGQWTGHGKVQTPNGQQNQAFIKKKQSQQNVADKIPNAEFLGSTRPLKQSAGTITGVTMNSGLPGGAPVASKPNLQLQSTAIVPNSGAPTKANAMSKTGGALVGDINTFLLSQAQASSFLDKGSRANPNANEAILSDNLGGATLGPNAHSLLQPTAVQQPEGQSSTLGNVQGSQKDSKQSSANLQPQANSIQSFAPLNSGDNPNKGSPNKGAIPSQGQSKNVPSSNDQHPPISTGTNNVQADTAQKDTSPSLLNAGGGPAAQTKVVDKPVTGNGITLLNTGTGGSQLPSTTPAMKSMQPPNALADSNRIDKSTAQRLTAGIALTSASRPPSQPVMKQPSTPKAVPYNNNAGSRNSVPGTINRVQTEIDKELALKNLLFPPPVSPSNQVHGTAINAFQTLQPQQLSRGQSNTMIPSFPAFRYDANLPAIGQTYRRNGIPHPLSASKNKKSMVPQHNPVPYKSSFPLMLHKISPYFKMKRNLKQVASEQAKARRRFLELQRKWYK